MASLMIEIEGLNLTGENVEETIKGFERLVGDYHFSSTDEALSLSNVSVRIYSLADGKIHSVLRVFPKETTYLWNRKKDEA